MTAALELTAVEHQFAGGVLALRDLTLQVAAGQFAALLGPSGSGKSTVLRLLAGLTLTRPSKGEARVASARAAPIISLVFQEPTLMPWASVRANVNLPLRIAGVAAGAAEERVAPLLAAIGLSEFANALPHELSGGMKMRSSFARALVTSPNVLLMDEPFAALDEITRQRLNDDLLSLWQRNGFTVLFVTHSVYEAVYLAQRVLVLSARPGHVVADVPIDEPYPRAAVWRMSPQFGVHCRAASAALEGGYGAFA